METLHLIAPINAPREKVWNTMLEDATYRRWTSAFCPGSHYRGEWKEGTTIRFIGPQEGKEGAETESGLIAHVKEVRPLEYIGLEHQGVISDGKDDTESDFVKAWKGAKETYTFQDDGHGGTNLIIDCQIPESEHATMEEMWLKALGLLKDLAEEK